MGILDLSSFAGHAFADISILEMSACVHDFAVALFCYVDYYASLYSFMFPFDRVDDYFIQYH